MMILQVLPTTRPLRSGGPEWVTRGRAMRSIHAFRLAGTAKLCIGVPMRISSAERSSAISSSETARARCISSKSSQILRQIDPDGHEIYIRLERPYHPQRRPGEFSIPIESRAEVRREDDLIRRLPIGP